MQIDEAIKELQDEICEHPAARDLPYYKALKLGIEALKRVQGQRAWYDTYALDLLPGETEK